MKKIAKFLSLILCLAMCLSFALAASAEETGNALTSIDELVSGQYYIVCSNGEGLGYLDGSWVLPGEDYAWTVTVTENGVTLQDCNGKYIAPKSGNANGIQEGEYEWAVSCEAGMFIFAGQGEDTTKLASNVSYENKFRAYKNKTINDNAEGYPCQFALYPAEEEVRPAGPVACEIPGNLEYTFATDDAAAAGVVFQWTATADGELSVSRMGESYMTSVMINGTYGQIGEVGYVVKSGDVVEITVYGYGAGAISVPVTFDVSGSQGDAAVGTEENPEILTSLNAGVEKTLESGIYYYQYTARKAGELTINTIGDGTHNMLITINGDTTVSYSNWDNDGNFITLTVAEGDVLTISVWFDFGAGTISFNSEFDAGEEPVPTPDPEPNPGTGDVIFAVLSIMAISGMGITAVASKKN